MNIKLLSTLYEVRRLSDDDIFDVLKICEGNPIYEHYCPPKITKESIQSDMAALPPNKTYEDKFYIGFYFNNNLISIMDLITRYPDDETIFIGFFMMRNDMQGSGIGSKIIAEALQYFKTLKFKMIKLGYVKENLQAKHFWEKNQFVPTKLEDKQEFYTIVAMEKPL